MSDSYLEWLKNQKKDKPEETVDETVQIKESGLGPKNEAALSLLGMGRFFYPGVPGEDLELTPEAQQNQKISNIDAAIAGVASGILKVPEGIFSLGAELVDLGFDTNTAAQVEEFFDTLNPFEEIAKERAVGRLTEALVSIGIPGALGAKVATKLATKALSAKRKGTLLNSAAPNLQKGLKETKRLNALTGKQKFAAVVAGGAAGETLVADVEEIGSFGDVLEMGPTQLDREEQESGSADAIRKLTNRLKFGIEAIPATLAVYGVGKTAGSLLKYGKNKVYSDSAIERAVDKLAGAFRFRGYKPREQALAKSQEQASRMVDTNFAKEQVGRIDKEISKIFPETKNFFLSANKQERKDFLKILNDGLFSGNLNKGIDETSLLKIVDTMSRRNASPQAIKTVVDGLRNSRNYFIELIRQATDSPGVIDLPQNITEDLSQLLGNRVKNSINNTFEIFSNSEAGFFQKFKPTREAVDKVKDIFVRYAAKNNQPITPETAEGFVNEIVNQVRRMDPKRDYLPTFKYPNLTEGADNAFNLKTFAQTLEKNLPDGKKETQIIGKGSKAFRELFGEIEDARHSIYETMNRLSLITRRGQMFQQMKDVDNVIKSKITPQTTYGDRGFFHATPKAAKEAFGPNSTIVEMPEGMRKYFPDENIWTSKEIADGFDSVSKLQSFMRGEPGYEGGPLGKTFSWVWRNLLLTPKAGAQFAKTILSIPTHIRNFLSSGFFAVGNGTILTDPRLIAEAMNNARKVIQVGMREPEAMAKYREYLDLGVVNTNVRLGDLRNLMRDVRFGEGNIATDSVLLPMLNTLGKNISKGVKKTGQFFQDLYVAEDDFWKIYNFEVELARLKKAYEKGGVKLGPNAAVQLKEEAAEIVKNTVPNYARVGQFVRAARMSPFGNFMSWPSEIFRTGFGVFNQAMKEIKNPVTRGIGMKRLIGMTFASAAIPVGLIEGSKAIFGVSDKEADAVNAFVAPWAVDSQKIIMKDPTDGQFYYIDWSRNNVYDTLTRPFQSVLQNIQQGIENEDVLLKGFIKGIVSAAGQTAEPFISESIFTEAFMDIAARNGVTREGKKLYTDSTPDTERMWLIFQHLGKTLMPTTQPFQRTYKAMTGKPGKGPEMYEIGPEMAGIFGMRPIKVNPKKGLAFRLYEFQKSQSEDRGLFTSGKYGVLSGEARTPQDLIERFFLANKALFNTQRKMKQILNKAQTLGVSEDELYEIFDKRGMSTKILGDLLDGNSRPFFPGKNIIKRLDDIAAETGIPNPFDAAEPILNKIYDDMYKQDLNKPFELNLNQYLPKKEEIMEETIQTSSTVPLPNTPMPDPGTFKVPVNNQMLASGLTRTEEVYLSPAEKLIRKQSRGLVS